MLSPSATLLPFVALSLLVSSSLAALLSSPDQLPTNVSYDYIVVGGKSCILFLLLTIPGLKHFIALGGTAGSVLANRLTEDASVNVLVIEAGSRCVSDCFTC
jgi:hypothetical protein